VRQVHFFNNEEYSALNIEFSDNSLVSFRFKGRIGFSIDPELSMLKGGNIVNWKKLKTRLVLARVARKIICRRLSKSSEPPENVTRFAV